MAANRIPFDQLMIGAMLNLLAQAVNRRVVETLHAEGFSDFRGTFHPVFQWCRPEGSRVSELAEIMGVTKSAMTQLADVLVKLGYVERVPDPHDGRATLIRRTERGWAVNRIARQAVDKVQQEWTYALGPEVFADMLQALRHLTRLTYDSPSEQVAG
jgi:DNA-binding MarR family transcriptional regulator